MRPLPLLLLAALLAVTGCYRSVAPPQRQPQVQVPAVWNSGKAAERTVDVHWWKQFRDPQLDALIEEALSNNHRLRAAADRLEAALHQARIAGADLAPSMAFALNSSRQRQNFIGLPLPGFAGSPHPGDARGSARPLTQPLLTMNVPAQPDRSRFVASGPLSFRACTGCSP